MTVYSEDIQAAFEMIQEAGGKIRLSLVIPGTRDPVSQDELTPEQTITVNTRGVILPPGKSRDFEPGSLVGRDVVECWVAAKGIATPPDKGWKLERLPDGKAWTVFSTTEYAPDGTPILWKFYAEA